MYGVGQSSPQRRGPAVIIGVMILVLMLLGLFFVFYTFVLKEDSATPVPSQEATETVAPTSTDVETVPPPTNTATAKPEILTPTSTVRPTSTNTPQPTPTLRPAPETITVGVRARVSISAGTAINLRDLPTLSGSTIITHLVSQAQVDVMDGPEDTGDLRWWYVTGGAAQEGWVVEAFGDQTWLTPIGWTDQLAPIFTPEPTNTPTPSPTAEPPTATPVVTPTATPTLVPVATSEITPTATSEITPTATPEGGIPSPTIGERAQITTRYQFVNLRQEPGLGAETIGQLENGTIVTILEGPEELDGLRWWKVDDGQGNVGWSAERVVGEVLLVPIP